jgi:hypothetical protein
MAGPWLAVATVLPSVLIVKYTLALLDIVGVGVWVTLGLIRGLLEKHGPLLLAMGVIDLVWFIEAKITELLRFGVSTVLRVGLCTGLIVFETEILPVHDTLMEAVTDTAAEFVEL